jgi:hypothetical protein
MRKKFGRPECLTIYSDIWTLKKSPQFHSIQQNCIHIYIKHIRGHKNETLSLDGEMLTPAVGAECCFNQETCKIYNLKKKNKKKIKK